MVGSLRNSGGTAKARPTKLDLRLAFLTLQAVQGGASRVETARSVGVARSTLQAWLARGRAGQPGYREWVEALDRAAEDRADLEVARTLLEDEGL